MNVLEIEVNGGFLDLTERTFRLELVNSMFVNDVFQGDYSFPYSVSATQNNTNLLKQVNYIEKSDKIVEYTCTLYLHGLPRFTGKLKVTRSTINTIWFTIHTGIRALNNIDKKIKEIDLGPDILLGNTQAELLANAKAATQNGDWKQYPYVFVPFNAPNFFNGLNPDYLGVVNRVNSTTGNLLANDFLTVNNKYLFVPWIFLFYFLDRIFKAERLVPSGSFWNDPEYSKILLFNNKSIDTRSEKRNLLLIGRNFKSYNTDNEKIEFDLGINCFDSQGNYDFTNQEYTITEAGTYSIKYRLECYPQRAGITPSFFKIDGGSFVFVFDNIEYNTLRQSATRFSNKSDWVILNLEFKIVAGSGHIGKTFYLKYNRPTSFNQGGSYIDMKGGYNETSLQHTWMQVNRLDELAVAPQKLIKFSNHIDDTTVGELLSEIKKWGVNFDFDFTNGKVNMDIADNLLRHGDEIDLNGKAEAIYEVDFQNKGKGHTISYEFSDEDKAKLKLKPELFAGEWNDYGYFPSVSKEGEWIIDKATNEIYIAKRDAVYGYWWENSGHNYADYLIGNGENKISLKIVPMLMCWADNEGGTANQNKALMPYYSGIGSSTLFGLGDNDFKMRLIFWRGLNNNGAAATQRGGNYVLASTGNQGANLQIYGQRSFRFDSTNFILNNCKNFLAVVNNSEVAEITITMSASDVHRVSGFKKMLVNNDLWLVKSISLFVSKTISTAKAYLYKI